MKVNLNLRSASLLNKLQGVESGTSIDVIIEAALHLLWGHLLNRLIGNPECHVEIEGKRGMEERTIN